MNVDTTQTQEKIPKDFKSEISLKLLHPSNAYGLVQTAKIFSILFSILFVTPHCVHYNFYTLVFIIPLLSIYIYKLTIVLHDCSHNTLFNNSSANKIVGNFCSFLLGVNFKTFTFLHWKHHKNYGDLDDPQGNDYLGLQNSSKTQIIFHLLKPLIGLNLFLKLGQLNQSNSVPRKNKNSLQQVFLVIIIQLLIAYLVTGFGAIWWLFFLYPACASTFSLFLSQIRGFCEHISPGMSGNEHHVRTHLPNLFDSLLFYDLNFNFHLEHHLYPQVPSCYLPTIYEKICKNQFHNAQTQSTSVLKTIYQRISETP